MRMLIFFTILLTCIACSSEEYYKADDFSKLDKIDSHVHLYTDRNFFVECAKQDKFKLLTITDDHQNIFTYVKNHYDYARFQVNNNQNEIQFATTFTMEGWAEPGWVNKTLEWLENGIKNGAVAVKVWKNIGMVFRDKDSILIMIDNPKFDTIFSMLAKKKIPVIGHLGEPKDCWLPFEEMISNGDRSYFKNNPQYHMYLHPEFPSYEEQIAARDHMLEKNPGLIFIGAHLGSMEWSVDELAKTLDKFPNMAVDLSARMGQLYYQTYQDREKVRTFFIKYQDRLIYGTDTGDKGTGEKDQLCRRMHDKWLADWRYFVTDDGIKGETIDKDFKGLKLPRQVVDKIYRTNYERWVHPF